MHQRFLSKIFNPQAAWYRGDFHAHTTFSDGVLTPLQLVELAKSEGLDFCAITDHNNVEALAAVEDVGDFLVLPGIEVTLGQLGDFNVFGLNPMDEWVRTFIDGKTWDELLDNARGIQPNDLLKVTAELGLLNSINHPFIEPWQWKDASADLSYVHCIEIWNDPSYLDCPQGNLRAVQFWSDLLNEGFRITAIGGSDYHQPAPEPGEIKPPERLGLPSTYLYLENLSGNAILDALRNQRAYVSMGAKIDFQAEVDGKTYPIGSDLGAVSAETLLTVTVMESALPATVHLVKNGKVIHEKPLTESPTVLRFTETLTPTQSVWYRLDVYDAQGQMLAISNPIFAGKRIEPKRKRIGEFWLR
ncbi:MAG: CehA/McbA family metallohydrolase [Anaerolineales bacterium]|nr:CehA/McbA family metallohydrolase [Anaerolineales bacterium]